MVQRAGRVSEALTAELASARWLERRRADAKFDANSSLAWSSVSAPRPRSLAHGEGSSRWHEGAAARVAMTNLTRDARAHWSSSGSTRAATSSKLAARQNLPTWAQAGIFPHALFAFGTALRGSSRLSNPGGVRSAAPGGKCPAVHRIEDFIRRSTFGNGIFPCEVTSTTGLSMSDRLDRASAAVARSGRTPGDRRINRPSQWATRTPTDPQHPAPAHTAVQRAAVAYGSSGPFRFPVCERPNSKILGSCSDAAGIVMWCWRAPRFLVTMPRY